MIAEREVMIMEVVGAMQHKRKTEYDLFVNNKVPRVQNEPIRRITMHHQSVLHYILPISGVISRGS